MTLDLVADALPFRSGNLLPHDRTGQRAERDFQLTGDPRGDREAGFALVLLEIREVGLGHLGLLAC